MTRLPAHQNLGSAAILVGMRPGAQSESFRMRLMRTDCASGGSVAHRSFVLALDWTELAFRATRLEPHVIVLDEKILSADMPLDHAARHLAVFAPVVVIAPAERQSQLVSVLAACEVDFVTYVGDFISVAAALVERRLRSPHCTEMEFHSAWAADLPSDFAEILRHQINNPLTGILGNAELLLSQLRGSIPPVSVQRLEIVVDLAVRLRETIRCLSSEWERLHPAIPSL